MTSECKWVMDDINAYNQELAAVLQQDVSKEISDFSSIGDEEETNLMMEENDVEDITK